ncbi:MAG: hypothetical protein Q4G69_04310 [Planctomycetia bacterium]|nr:hypothetical protein [Planctomycetia bacterium]
MLRYGRWGHLIIALSFVFSFNAAIILNYHWVDCVPAGGKKWVLLLLAALWGILSVLADIQSKKYERILNYDTKGDLFLQATTFYLKGNWFETECMIRKLLQNNPGDVEARLMLVTLFRHTDRFNEAEMILRELGRFENAKKWHYEILLEKIALQNALNAGNGESEQNTSSSEDSLEDSSESTEQLPDQNQDNHPDQKEIPEPDQDYSGKPRLRIVHPDEDPVSEEQTILPEINRPIPFGNQKQLLERNA